MINLLGPFPTTRSGNKFVVLFHENNVVIATFSCTTVTADIISNVIIGFMERYGIPIIMRLDPEVFCQEICAIIAGRLQVNGILLPMTPPQVQRSEQICRDIVEIIHRGIEYAQNMWDELLDVYIAMR